MVKYKDALKELQNHQNNDYHRLSTQRANDFLINFENTNNKSVNVLLDKHKQQTIEYNRKRLMPIVKTILFCARHNIPLRGHREMGSMASGNVRDFCLNGEQGVFRGLLAFRIECGDTDLLNHLETAPKNCTMISPQIQNEVIEAIGSVIEKKIVERIKSSKFYSILCDETTDLSTEEQMTVCIRYVDLTNCVIQEDFLGFVKMTSTTGVSIKNAIKQKLEELGLSLDNLRGQGYDGGSNMAGKNNGVQALILNEQPLAFYTHCFSHSLNLCITKACEVSSIKHMMGVIGAVASFFSASAKRADKLKSVIESEISNTESNKQRKTKLKTLCETRWVERHDSLMTFKELYVFILNALEELQHDSNTETSSKALLYLNSITKSEFLVAIDVAALCLAYTLQLSVALQSKQQDLSRALSDVMVIKGALQSLREDADNQFNIVFKNVIELGEKINIEIRMPRICNRQINRINIDSENAEIYFKRSIFFPFLDYLIQSMDTRFDNRLSSIIPLEGLIPSHFDEYDDRTILEAAKIYSNDLSNNMNSTLKAELSLWRQQWKTNNIPKPVSAIESMSHCTNLVPNIKLLLQLFATLPVTSATPERTFSTLSRMKTYLRSTMMEKRLNGLAMANINKKELVKEADIIQVFAQNAPRRMQLKDWSL